MERDIQRISLRSHAIVEDVANLLPAAEVDSKAYHNLTPLHCACIGSNKTVIESLLDDGADLDATTEIYGTTPLHVACQNGNTEAVQVLLQRGADTEVHSFKDEVDDMFFEVEVGGSTPLHLAVRKGHQHIVEVLLKGGALVNSQQGSGSTPLHVACREEHTTIVEVLIQNGAHINAVTNAGDTPLHQVAASGITKMVQLLLAKGANVNVVNKMRYTPLHKAADEAYDDVVHVLVENGANVNAQTLQGDTPLNLAAKVAAFQVVKTLLLNHADVNITNSKNVTPYACSVYETFRHNDGVDQMEECNDDDFFKFNHFSTAKVFTRHLAVMKVRGLFISEQNLLTMKNEKVANYSLKCEEEIAGIISEKIANTNISLFDVLMKHAGIVEGYLRNENILEALQSEELKIKFPLYSLELNKKIADALERKNLLEEGSGAFHLLFKDLSELPDGCVENVLTFFSNEDLRVLMDACCL